ncbi:M14 family zinc carboxypeptidase [Aliikangiella coralliicola]|uniref:carboxypeptidase T n=1 Tax=Aliikangiella coralliicola TaxID=2592383 RepID=A0A545UDL4_9GAMM|nr:M14 family zinc carboxypeptidase [Aliikangiella coralliicola]TQV87539.1 PKD domain-containing protein [Aliikangiella coralliicola]
MRKNTSLRRKVTELLRMSVASAAICTATVTSFYATASTLQPINASRVEVADPAIARKIAISFHHAILETNYAEGYIIADLSDAEIARLKAEHFSIKPANNWQKKYAAFQQQLKEKISSAKNGKQVAGIPGYECYATVEETYQQAADLAATHSQLSEWIDIGDSWQKTNNQGGYDLMVLKITNKNISGEKPKLFIHSAMHAREYTPAALTLDFAKQLLNEYSSNADIQWIVDHREIHLLFHMNPDGRKIAESGVYQRKNTNQNHCANNSVGVDLNRNFAFFWNTTANGSSGNECDETFRGASAESEPETKAVSDYIRGLFPDARGPNEQDGAPQDTPGMHLDIHSYSELVLWPYGHTDRISPNNSGFVALGNKLAFFNGYTPQQSVGLYPTDGTSDDVSYGELGIAALTFELGTNFFQQCSVYQNKIKPDNLPALVYSAKVAAAPYLLAYGPEVTKIELNGAEDTISITQGAPIELAATASAVQTKLSANGRTVSRIEYSIDTPIWEAAANIIELTETDGNLNSGVEVIKGQIDTSTLTQGQHMLFVRAYDGNGKVGVPSAAFINISQNNSPTPEFTHQCTDLKCDFDASNSSDTDGNIVSFEWDFHDGNQGTGETISHTFGEAGDKNITLKITDNAGSSAEKSAQLTVSEPVVVTPPTPPTTPPASSSGGGLIIWLNAALAGLWLLRKRRKR